MKKRKAKVYNRIVVGEGFVGINPDGRTEISLYKDFDGYDKITHNIAFINHINTTKSKYRLVLERVRD